jgi:site-specific DNA-cytosine methylase
MEQGVLDSAPVWSNLKTFPAKEFYGKIHGITGGYPCQPFSVAGERKGVDDERHLFPHISKIIDAVRPVWCFFENVGGHLTMGYDEVYRSLSDLGYSVEAGIFSAEEVGAPHQRERLFILGYANSNGDKKRNAAGRIGIHQVKVEGKEIERQRIWVEPLSASEEMANATIKRLSQPRPSTIRKLSAETRERIYDRLKQSGSGVGLANSKEQRPQRNVAARDSSTSGCADEYGGTHWPARPGQDQYEWEEPRTIPQKVRRKSGTKSGMGTTINGYNFREDLLRMAGNGVVEQTAEKAFIELWSRVMIDEKTHEDLPQSDGV